MYVLSGMGATDPAQQCQMGCYDDKSRAYDTCRSVPVADEKERFACFQRADTELQSCLARCSSPSGATIAAIAGIGLLAIGLMS